MCMKKKGEQLSGVTSWAGLVSFQDFRSTQRVWFKEEREEEEEEDENEEGGERSGGRGRRGGRRRRGRERKKREKMRERRRERKRSIRSAGSVYHPRWPVLHDVGPLQTPPQLFRHTGLGQRFL